MYPAPFTHRVLILCHEKGITYQLNRINTYQKPDWFLAISPLGQVPVMRVNDIIIHDSRAIWEYLDSTFKPHLLPTDPILCAKHRSWIAFADELAHEIAQFVKLKKILIRDLCRLDTLFKILDDHLIGPFFFGKIVSLVDITLISHILWLDALEQRILPCSILFKYPKLVTWLNLMKERPSLKETMGDNYTHYFIELLQNHDLIQGLLPEQ
jgi:glutathione S-transferase